MPLKNTTLSKHIECDTCVARSVCRWMESVKQAERLAKVFRFECKYYIQGQSNSQKSAEACEICGRPTFKLYECERCHKKVCGDCVEIDQMLDVNTGEAEEEVLCKNCAEED